MKLLDLYEWIAGSMSSFTKPFQENEALFNQAKAFWRHLEGSTMVTIAIFIVLGILLAAIYYKPYNDKPGRHYRPTHWLFFLIGTFVLTLLVTWGYEYLAVKPVLKGALMLEFKVALGNAIYAAALYFVTSLVWCNALPTNAYRLFKF